MANISSIKLPNGNTYNLKVYSDHIAPIINKTYTDVIGTANSWAGATFFFGSIKPDSWDGLWEIKYKIKVYVPGKDLYSQNAEVMLCGFRDTYKSYYSLNRINTNYVAYYHELYNLKQAGFTNGYGHALGVRFYSAYNPIDTNYKRTIEVEIESVKNCTFSFFDSCSLYANIPGTGSTNYYTYREFDFVNNGLQETGDANDANYYNREYYVYRYSVSDIYRYQILLENKEGKLVPVNNINNSVATTKTYNTTDEFDPFGQIYYYNSTSSITSRTASLPNGALYRQYLCDMRYSFNIGGYDVVTLVTNYKPFYLVAVPQSNGMAKIYSDAWTQDLPTTEDGRIYIYLGYFYPETQTYRLALSLQHPVFWYKDGDIRPFLGLTHTVNSDVPSGAKFTDTVTTATTTGSGNAVTAITASNGALTVTKGTTFLTSHQDISGKADKSATVSTITWDSTNNKLTKTINGSTTDVVTLATIKTALGSMPASDVYSWAKASSKPSYNFSEIGSKPTTISGYGITDAYTKTEVDNKVSAVLRYKGVKAAVSNLPTTGNTTGDVWHVTATSGEYAWDGTEWQELGTAISIPANTGSSTTGISIANHSTTSIYPVSSSTISVYGVSTSTTTASKVTLGTAKSVPNVTSAGSASNWVFEDVTVPIRADSATSIPNVTSAGTAASWTFGDVTVPIRADADTTVPTAASSATTVPKAATSATTVPIKNTNATTVPTAASSATACDDITSWAAGSGSASLTFTMDTTDTKKLKIAFSHTHTAPTLEYTARSITGVSGSTSIYGVQSTTTSVTGVSGSTSVTGVSGSTTVRGVKTGTSSTTTASHVTGGGNGTAPTLGTAISIYGVKSGTGSTTTASHVKSGGNGTAPTLGTAISIPNVTGVTDVTVPIKNADATVVPIKSGAVTVVTSATHSVTDNGHTHTI